MVVYKTFDLAQYARELQVLWDFRFGDDVKIFLDSNTQVALITSKGKTYEVSYTPRCLQERYDRAAIKAQGILQRRAEDYATALRHFLNEVGMISLDDLYPAFSTASHGKELELSRADMPSASIPDLLRALFGEDYIEFVHKSKLYVGLRYRSWDLDTAWYNKRYKVQHALTTMCLDHPHVFGESLNDLFKLRFSISDNMLISISSSFVTIDMLNMGRRNTLLFEFMNVDVDAYKLAEINKVNGTGQSQIIYRDTIIDAVFSPTIVINHHQVHEGTPEVNPGPGGGGGPNGAPQTMSPSPAAPQVPAEPIPEPAPQPPPAPAAKPGPQTSSQVPQRSQWAELTTFGFVTGASGMFSQAAEDGYTQSGGYY
ncbi:hypothetical protein SAICODRAFT_228149 [Saitoella complicata NRRL Y-17804]|nr:uncharacterized protein SAICODRAFT_228149 [Saitoella complicata NRRL Y-17804]ODQ55549.1 hypothetical protein SAICODRAFT_228149 [Saitoella complicata NRRL Y-17804]